MPTSRVFWTSFKQFLVPALIALAFTAIQYLEFWSLSGNVTKAIATFFTALFFIMYFYGQYKRVEKQTQDRDAFQDLNEQLSSLGDMVRGLQPIAPPAVPGILPPQYASVQGLLEEAKQLLASGHILAALLQAGVAFEQAVRGFARMFNLDQSERAPLGLRQLLKKIESVLPPKLVPELHALRQIRNRLTHVSEEELIDLPDAQLILRNYEWAISQLSNHIASLDR